MEYDGIASVPQTSTQANKLSYDKILMMMMLIIIIIIIIIHIDYTSFCLKKLK